MTVDAIVKYQMHDNQNLKKFVLIAKHTAINCIKFNGEINKG